MADERFFQPTNEWPLQEQYKRELHAQIQRWGEKVAPVFDDRDTDEREEREELFQFLMEAVVRGDSGTAELVAGLDNATQGLSTSWYSDRPGNWDKSTLRVLAQRDFNALFCIYKAGKEGSLR